MEQWQRAKRLKAIVKDMTGTELSTKRIILWCRQVGATPHVPFVLSKPEKPVEKPPLQTPNVPSVPHSVPPAPSVPSVVIKQEPVESEPDFVKEGKLEMVEEEVSQEPDDEFFFERKDEWLEPSEVNSPLFYCRYCGCPHQPR